MRELHAEVLIGLYNKFKQREKVLHIKYMKEREFSFELKGESLTLHRKYIE